MLLPEVGREIFKAHPLRDGGAAGIFKKHKDASFSEEERGKQAEILKGMLQLAGEEDRSGWWGHHGRYSCRKLEWEKASPCESENI